MLRILWDTRGYFFWLLVVSALCLALERLRPWRKEQRLFRRQFGQDLFWLFFNGHYAGILVASVGAWLLAVPFAVARPAVDAARSARLLADWSAPAQFVAFLVAKDFLEWWIHVLMHRVPWLWAFHKVHHSIEELDWIGNFRFHWMEIVVYRGLTYLPLIALGATPGVVLAVAVVGTLIGHLNHANLDISWGPLRYLLNSPRMHVWHHDHETLPGRPYGANYAICLSAWDWLFGTAFWPATPEGPARLGFRGDEKFPRGLVARLLLPVSRLPSLLSKSGRSAK